MSLSPALTQLAVLPVKGRAPMTGYSRAAFGPAWSDDVSVAGGHNGCDTRNDILRRDLVAVTIKAGSNGCTVTSGTLPDSYTGTTVGFTRGAATSTAVQIDHMVSLGDAWQTGAQQLSSADRENLANDPRNLQATIGSVNDEKGDGDAATWLPPNKAYRCTYVARQITVKAAYRLWVTPPEKQAMQRVLNACPADTGATTSGTAGTAIPAPATAPPVRAAVAAPTAARVIAPVVHPAPAPPPTTSAAAAGAYYKNCAAARAAGAAPILRGQPGYRAALDRDGDGVACET